MLSTTTSTKMMTIQARDNRLTRTHTRTRTCTQIRTQSRQRCELASTESGPQQQAVHDLMHGAVTTQRRDDVELRLVHVPRQRLRVASVLRLSTRHDTAVRLHDGSHTVTRCTDAAPRRTPHTARRRTLRYASLRRPTSRPFFPPEYLRCTAATTRGAATQSRSCHTHTGRTRRMAGTSTHAQPQAQPQLLNETQDMCC
jgi:hypothetical protein